MRAPPLEQMAMNGSLRRAASSRARVTFSPTTEPILPPMKAKSETAITACQPAMRPTPVITASCSPVRSCARASRSGYGIWSEKRSGSMETSSRFTSSKVSSSTSMFRRSAADIGKWCPHCGQTR